MKLSWCWAVSLLLAGSLLWGQASQPNPAPTPTVISPAPPEEVRKLQELLTRPATPHSPDEPIPQAYMIYHLYFLHLSSLDALAQRIDARGGDGEKWRTHEQRLAGLNEEQGKILVRVAYECKQDLEEQDKEFQKAAAAVRQQYPGGQFAYAPPPELDRIWEGRILIITSHIDQLRVLLGEPSFQKLDDWVMRNFRSVQKPAAPAAQANPAVTNGRLGRNQSLEQARKRRSVL